MKKETINITELEKQWMKFILACLFLFIGLSVSCLFIFRAVVEKTAQINSNRTANIHASQSR